MDNNANNARRMYFIYVVNAKKGHLKGADKSTFCFCRQLGLICYLKDPDPEPEPDPERIRIGTAKKKSGSTTLPVCMGYYIPPNWGLGSLGLIWGTLLDK